MLQDTGAYGFYFGRSIPFRSGSETSAGNGGTHPEELDGLHEKWNLQHVKRGRKYRGKQKEKQRKKPPKILKKRICIQYTTYNYNYSRGLRGLPLTRWKNVYILRILPTLKGLQLTKEKELADRGKGQFDVQKLAICNTFVNRKQYKSWQM